MPETINFKLRTEFITLSQLLKATGIVGQGSDAKPIIEAGECTINGEVDVRRGRKLRPGDVLVLGNGVTITVD